MKPFLFLGLILSPLPSAATFHEIKKDQFVLVAHRYALLDQNELHFSLEAMVFENGSKFLQRALMLSVCRYLDIDCDRLSPLERKTFFDRTRLAVAHFEEDARLRVAIGGSEGELPDFTFESKKSSSDGTILQSFKLPIPEDRELSAIHWQIQNLAGRPPELHHSTMLDLSSGGLSIVSDIDDTIRETYVLDQKRMLKTIFFEPFQQVEPILKRIRELRKTSDGSFVPLHFVSGGPAILVESLIPGLDLDGLRDSELYLRPFQLRARSVYDFFREDTYVYKLKQIREIFDRYPLRHFVMIGDSGEKDPEVYRKIYELYPQRVEKIIIRRIRGARNEPSRFQDLPVEFVDEVSNLDERESSVNP